MKNLQKVLAKLKKALAVAPVETTEPGLETDVVYDTVEETVDTTAIVNLTRVICSGVKGGVQYTITERDIIEATMCGEAATCSGEDKMRILAVAYNRARARPQTSTRGRYQFHGIVANLVKLEQYSCWNDGHYSGIASNAFDSCDNLKERVDYLKGLCLSGSTLPAVGETETRQKLIELGFNGPTDPAATGYEKHRDARYVFHYSTPAAFKKQGNECLKSLDLSPGKKYEISFSEYDPIKDKNGKPSLFADGNQKCKKRSYKSIVATDGCHSYASNLDKPYRENSDPTTVPCPPGTGLRRVCDGVMPIAS